MGWVKEALATVLDALGVRKYVVFFSAAGAAAALSALTVWLLGQPAATSVGAILYPTFFLATLALFLFFITLNYASGLRRASKTTLIIRCTNLSTSFNDPTMRRLALELSVTNSGLMAISNCKVRIEIAPQTSKSVEALWITKQFPLMIGETCPIRFATLVRTGEYAKNANQTGMEVIHYEGNVEQPLAAFYKADNFEIKVVAYATEAPPADLDLRLTHNAGTWVLHKVKDGVIVRGNP